GDRVGYTSVRRSTGVRALRAVAQAHRKSLETGEEPDPCFQRCAWVIAAACVADEGGRGGARRATVFCRLSCRALVGANPRDHHCAVGRGPARAAASSPCCGFPRTADRLW